MFFSPNHYDFLRNLYRGSKLPFLFRNPLNDFQLIKGAAANELISDYLQDDKPVMIGRFGYGELRSVVIYAHIIRNKFNGFKYVFGDGYEGWWPEAVKNGMPVYNGFFPSTEENLNKFGELMLENMKAVDVLASWIKYEKYFEKELAFSKKIPLGDLDPYFHENPWTLKLKNKNVLVIHPFEKSIRSQYARREKLFANSDILPAFTLKTIAAVQSVAGNNGGFNSWFDALESMKAQIRQVEFDIAIIGCGAYGFPLAAYVKSLGKKAVHLGGATQVLFGIKGARWEERPEFSAMMNEYWVKPLEEERPAGAEKVEGGCYW